MSHSSYWLGGRNVKKVNLASRGNSTAEAIELAGLKRGISNFVKIFTKRDIPVMFSSGEQSYATGKHIVISANTSERAFDAIVGTSLHESSHIVWDHMLAFLKYFIDVPMEVMTDSLLKIAIDKKGYTIKEVTKIVKHLLNVFEDRRVDYWAFRTAPGYRPYYDAFYKAYWESPQIDLGLQSGHYNTPTIGNYIYHITNMINPWFDTRSLPDLDWIYGMVDVNNIDRFDSDRWHPKRKKILPGIFILACDVAEIIFTNSPERPLEEDKDSDIIMMPNFDPDPAVEPNLDPPEGNQGIPIQIPGDPEETDDDDSEGGEGQSSGKSGAGDDEDESEDGSGSDEDKDEKGEGEDEDESDDGRKDKHATSEKPEADTLNDEVLQRDIKRQQDVADGKVEKQELTPDMAKDVQSIESTDASIENVDFGGRRSAKVIVIRNITKAVIESRTFQFGESHPYYESTLAVTNGIRLGKLLAQKLSIRNQTKIARRIRRKRGHIYRRRLAAIGAGERDVFQTVTKTKFDPVLLHLTLDASGSMGGNKWGQGMGVGVSLAQAASEIENLDVVISIRAGDFSVSENFATIAIIYDSRKDTMTKIRSLFPLLRPNGNTPEGLCFQALMKELIAEKHGERYFVNISDGDPWFHEYAGNPAYHHTREQVNQLRGNGLKVMSYYVGWGDDHDGFRMMYGKDAEFIDVTQIAGLVRTLNKLFLRR